MTPLPDQIAALPTMTAGGQTYLSYQTVIETAAASLFPDQSQEEIDAAAYQRILEAADAYCREAGYTEVVKLTPPTVPMAEMGLYWTAVPSPTESFDPPDPPLIHAGPGRAEMLEDGRLLDARLSQRGLDEVSGQHFTIPVTASDEVIALMDRAAASDWPNDYKGVWTDILGMCIAGGEDAGGDERRFTVIIRGLGRRRYWHFRARLQGDGVGSPYLHIGLADEDDDANQTEKTTPEPLFELGHVVMTPGAAALGVDFAPYLARHAAGDDGDLDAFDKRQNRQAIRSGARILSAYDIPTGEEEPTRIWVITEADRSATTILLPREY